MQLIKYLSAMEVHPVPVMVADLDVPATGLHGFTVIDSLVAGRAMGGTRMTPTVSRAELAQLARQMTLKLALAGLRIGGAKAGIVSELPPGRQRDGQLRSFGQVVAPLLHGGVYLGTDEGVSYHDRAVIFAAAGYEVAAVGPSQPLPCSWATLWDSCADITGHGVAEATCAAVQQIGIAGRRLRVTIQGFGTVGRGTAKRLAELDFLVVGVADRLGTVSSATGLPLPELLAATDATGTMHRDLLPSSVTVSSAPEAWLDVDADVLVLAASGAALRADNVHRVIARVVVEGANGPCTDDAILALFAAGVPVIPGIVANCGGAMVTGLVLTGGAPAIADTATLVSELYDRVRAQVRARLVEVFERAESARRPLPAIAIRMGEELARGATAEPRPASATQTM
jgi:glutamate dehydrogenase (NAD(P)+)